MNPSPSAVVEALERYGLLLIQGQWEIPSLADLLAGAPVTTRGYSWDYVPAWRLADELAGHPDIAVIKLWRGKQTLVHRRHWPAIETLARAARASILSSTGDPALREMLLLIESEPGITGLGIRERLDSESKAFQKLKGKLDVALCILGEHQDETEGDPHTHDYQWTPWSTGKIGQALKSAKRLPTQPEAIASLLTAAEVGATPRQIRTLLPVVGYTKET